MIYIYIALIRQHNQRKANCWHHPWFSRCLSGLMSSWCSMLFYEGDNYLHVLFVFIETLIQLYKTWWWIYPIPHLISQFESPEHCLGHSSIRTHTYILVVTQYLLNRTTVQVCAGFQFYPCAWSHSAPVIDFYSLRVIHYLSELNVTLLPGLKLTFLHMRCILQCFCTFLALPEMRLFYMLIYL